MKLMVCWFISWSSFYIGDMFADILNLNDESETWARFWYVPYDKCMSISLYFQNIINPSNATMWPWSSLFKDE